MALKLDPLDSLPEQNRKYFALCEEKLGFVPNVLKAHSFKIEKLDAFTTLYNELMLAESNLSKLDREMIAVTVSAINKCYYCLAAHGAAIRQLSGDPKLGDMIVMNFRVANLNSKQRAMLEFAEKVTQKSAEIEQSDRDILTKEGFSDRDIWDITNVTAFFNMTNRVASATAMKPNDEYHSQYR